MRHLLCIFLSVFVAAAALADTVYVDTSGIDSMEGLTAQQKQDLKDKIKDDMQANFDAALGPGVVTVSTNAADAATADRHVHIQNDTGTHTNADGSTGYHYGNWPGADGDQKGSEVHIKNFTERHGDDYKTGGAWDLDKLAKGIGRTAAHEVAHSYGADHNDNAANATKMTDGGLVPSSDRATKNWAFDAHAAEQIRKNLNKKPAAPETKKDEDSVVADYYQGPEFPHDLDEHPYFDARVQISGPMAELVDLGWRGRDSDGGLHDGNSSFDFVYKASEAETPGMADWFMITFPCGLADSALQFVLRGRPESPWPNQWFPMRGVILQDPVTAPDGNVVYRQIRIEWDLNADSFFDVFIECTSNSVYGPMGAMFNGWTLRPGADKTTIYWTDMATDRILRFRMNVGVVEDVVATGLTDPFDIAADPAEGKIYWSEAGTGRIRRANLDGSGMQDLVLTGLTDPFEIALDGTARKLYWANRLAGMIFRANLDGTNIEPAVFTGVIDPFDVAVAPSIAKIYWTVPPLGLVRRADLNGANVEDVLATGLTDPFDLLVSSPQKLYWSDRVRGMIRRADLNGTNIEDAVATGLMDPFDIAMPSDGSKVYWTDHVAGRIMRADPNGLNLEPAVAAGAHVTSFVVIKPAPADFDGDGDVDLMDFGRFQGCFNGPNRPAKAPDCDDADRDHDGDVDLMDFGVFQGCFNGPNRPAKCM